MKIINRIAKHARVSLTTLLICLPAPLLHADDTEVFLSSTPARANILFVMDLSGSMNWAMNDGSGKTRIAIMKDALSNVITDAPDNLNIGIQTFGKGRTSPWWLDMPFVQGIGFPISEVNANAHDIIGPHKNIDNLINPNSTETVRNFLARLVKTWDGDYGTPIVDALYEAALYYRGENVYWGNKPPSDLMAAHPSTYTGSTKRYISPIKSECEANYIVLLSDGAPSFDLDSKGTLANAVKAKGCATTPTGLGRCGKELTRYLADNDNSSSIPGDQKITTYTIGFGKGMDTRTQDYLRTLTTKEDDPQTSETEGYFTADNEQALLDAFDTIFEEVSEDSPGFSAPSYNLDAATKGMSHSEDVYLALTMKDHSSTWSGNLKKFKLVNSTSDNGKAVRKIRGANNRDAVDNVGIFTEEALDFWSNSGSADGGDVMSGGVVDHLDNPAQRRLYTNAASDTSDTNINLTSLSNKIDQGNSNITKTMLGEGISNNERKDLLDFARGWRKDESNKKIVRKHMGDILHFNPITLSYSGDKKYIFTGTNEGYLHAFSTSNGEEEFAFMPKQLLKTLKAQHENKTHNIAGHVYGVDGQVSVWHNDLDHNSLINDYRKGEEVEKAYLYFGLRRGGNAYYALDITNIKSPKLAWYKTNDDEAFSTLGQSWSKPYVTNFFDKDNKKQRAVVFTGGYDPAHDNADQLATGATSTIGNDIFIVDATTGQKLWSKEDLPSAMADQLQHSIPGGARLIDMNHNGVVDRMYFADTGGNVWRLDINESLGRSKNYPAKSQLTKLASLGGTGAHNRMFFNEPDVGILKHEGVPYITVSIGSGYRAHPLNKEIDDHFFVLLDPNVESVPDIGTDGGSNGGDNNEEEEDNDPNKICMIVNDNSATNRVFNLLAGDTQRHTGVGNLLVCHPAPVYTIKNLDIIIRNGDDDTSKSNANYAKFDKFKSVKGQQCITTLSDDVIYTEYQHHPSSSHYKKDHDGYTIESAGSTDMGYLAIRTYCQSYDKKEYDPRSSLATSSTSKTYSSDRFNKWRDRCTNNSNTECTEMMTVEEAIKWLISPPAPSQSPSTSRMAPSADSVAMSDSAAASVNINTAAMINMTDLAEVTITEDEGDISVNYGDLEETNVIDAGKKGWFVKLPNDGEKVLANAMTNRGSIYFTSFVPEYGGPVESCSPSNVQGRMYALDILTAQPKTDLNKDGKMGSVEDIYTVVSGNSIPTAPQKVYNDIECSNGECEHKVDIRVGRMLEQADTYDSAYMESVYWSTDDKN